MRRLLLCFVCLLSTFACAQIADRISGPIDQSQLTTLPGHLPQWAKAERQVGSIAPDVELDHLELSFSHTTAQTGEIQRVLRSQQTPGTSDFHRSLSDTEIASRFGLSASDIEALSSFLQANGLKVEHIAHTRQWLVFGGTAAAIERAFNVKLGFYTVGGERVIAIDREPSIPSSLAPVVREIVGLVQQRTKPSSVRPNKALNSKLQATSYELMPADFEAIYAIPFGPHAQDGTGQTIGIVGRANIFTADLDNFSSITGIASLSPRLQTIPASSDQPPAAMPNPPFSDGCGNVGTDDPATVKLCEDQREATLDVTRAGSVANGATLDYFVSSSGITFTMDGSYISAEYAIDNFQQYGESILSISFGGCETGDEPDTNQWETLANTAAMHSISVFASSGDSGTNCADEFDSPVAGINLYCAPSSVTCVGGTEFTADVKNPATYWDNGVALKHIPEGAWNDSIASQEYLATTGGGFSQYISQPSWQADAVGFESDYRSVPDLSFTASANHDGYFLCMAADDMACSTGQAPLGGGVIGGTSATAPSMAGIMALINEQQQAAQGDANPTLYFLAQISKGTCDSTSPTAVFCDVTPATAVLGGESCSSTIVDLCNNDTPDVNGLLTGYSVAPGYDLVTGWGSANVTNLLAAWQTYGTPGVSGTALSSSVKKIQQGNNSIVNFFAHIFGQGASTPTGTVTFSYNGASLGQAPVVNGEASFSGTVGTIPPATYPIVATYSGDSNYSGSKSSPLGIAVQAVTVTTLTSSDTTPIQGSTVTLTATVKRLYGTGIPTGHVTFSYAGGSLATVPLNSSGVATLTASTAGVPTANYTVTATYSGDSLDYYSSSTLTVGVSSVDYSFLSSFIGGDPQGYEPNATLMQASDMNYYGTTAASGCAGTIFDLSSGNVYGLYSFYDGNSCSYGGAVSAGLIEGSDGIYYGETAQGGLGSGGGGTVFSFTSEGTLTTLYYFCSLADCADGGGAYDGLVEGSDGRLYGTTSGGGSSASNGTIFVISKTGTFNTLYTFCQSSGCLDGSTPLAGLIQATDGYFYGTTSQGGTANEGTLFKISPTGAFQALYSFCSLSNCADGGTPKVRPMQASDGNLYGVANTGGANNQGTLWKFNPTTNTMTTFYSFCHLANCADGATGSSGPLIQASDGNIYGVLNYGGTEEDGVIFKISLAGYFTPLYPIDTGQYGSSAPNSGLVQGSDGAFYGVTRAGGSQNIGTLYALSVNPPLPAPVSVSASPSTANPGQNVTVRWTVVNSTSHLSTRCTVFLNGTPIETSGESGSTTVQSATAGANQVAVTCGGTESGFASFTVN